MVMIGGPPPEEPRRWRGTARDTIGSPRARPGRRSRGRWDPALIESLKVVVAEVPKRERPPETICVSLFEWNGHPYVDLRLYRAGHPTRNGLPIHRDLLPAVLRGLGEAVRAL